MAKTFNFPVALLPVKLETRFIKRKKIFAPAGKDETQELWVRIFPDQVFIDSFDPELSIEEWRARNQYRNKTTTWEELVALFGVYRASWIIQANNEDIGEENDAVASADKKTSFKYRCLPDYFTIYLFQKTKDGLSEKKFKLKEINVEAIELLEEKKDNWLTNFQMAVDAGLAGRIPIDTTIKEFERVIAIGYKEEKVKKTTESIKHLLRSHQYSTGFSFLDDGTPTNNLKGLQSGFSSAEGYDAINSKAYCADGELSLEIDNLDTSLLSNTDETPDDTGTTPDSIDKPKTLVEILKERPFLHKTYGRKLSEGLGITADTFKHVKNADGHASRLDKLIQRTSWFALGGQMLEMLLGDELDRDTHLEIWDYYSKYVDAKGPLPCVKIEDLPYGILPVTHLRGILEEKDDIIYNGTTKDKTNFVFVKLFEEWLKMVRSDRSQSYVPRMEDIKPSKREEELVKILSMEPRSSFFQLRMMELERAPHWLSGKITTPLSIHSYPPVLLHELLKKVKGYDRDVSKAKQAYAELNHLFSRLTSDKAIESLQYSPVLSFKDVAEIRLSNTDIPLTRDDDWHKTAYLEFLKDINQSSEHVHVPWYKGESSLLIDLLLRAYSNALHLFHRDVYFQPSLDNTAGISSYFVSFVTQKKTFDPATDDNGTDIVVTFNRDNPKEIKIKVPFKGTIEEIYVNQDETIRVENGRNTIGVIENKKFKEKKDEKFESPRFFDGRLFRIKDESGFNEMHEQMVALGTQIVLEIERLKEDKKDYIHAQEEALKEALDLNTYRLDAWLTGIASRLLDEKRNLTELKNGKEIKPYSEGLYYGAYGWVENLKKDTKNEVVIGEDDKIITDGYARNGGIIHCPTPAQTIASVMFRQSFSTYEAENREGNLFKINLTSDRIQKSKQFMEGIRQNQEVEALLGYRFERFLHENNQDVLIYPLRQKYPLDVNVLKGKVGKKAMSTINGLSLIDDKSEVVKNYSKKKGEVIENGIDMMENILDGSADILFYEAGYQMSQGNFSQAAAAMDAAKGEIAPPQIESLDTRISGAIQEHSLIMLLEPADSSSFSKKNNPKAFIEPTLEKWLKNIIGALDTISCKVDLSIKIIDDDGKEATVSVGSYTISVNELDIGYLDLLEMSNTPLEEDASELAQRIMSVVKQKYDKAPPIEEVQYAFREEEDRKEEMRSLQGATATMRYICTLLQESRYLKTEDIYSNKEQENEITDEFISPDYIIKLKKKIEDCIGSIEENKSNLSVLSLYNIQNAKGSFFNTNGNVVERCEKEVDKLLKQLKSHLDKFDQSKKHTVQVRHLEEAVQYLFGKSFIIIPPFIPSPGFLQAIEKDQEKLVKKDGDFIEKSITGGQERIIQWMEGRAIVNQETEAFSDFLMASEMWGSEKNKACANPYLENWEFRIAQFISDNPLGNGVEFPWTALNINEIKIFNKKLKDKELFYPRHSQSAVVFMPKSMDVSNMGNSQFGLFINQFSETIPDKEIDTGLAFEYNAPNNEAQQAILLAVSYDEKDWNEDKLKNIVFDTMDLAKVRMVDADALQKFDQILPMAYWMNIPNVK